jgi:hypothetical protein
MKDETQYPQELLDDIREVAKGDPTFERRMEVHRKWVVSGRVDPDEWLRLVQEVLNGRQ